LLQQDAAFPDVTSRGLSLEPVEVVLEESCLEAEIHSHGREDSRVGDATAFHVVGYLKPREHIQTPRSHLFRGEYGRNRWFGVE
jgi:hypothetical protein